MIFLLMLCRLMLFFSRIWKRLIRFDFDLVVCVIIDSGFWVVVCVWGYCWLWYVWVYVLICFFVCLCVVVGFVCLLVCIVIV